MSPRTAFRRIAHLRRTGAPPAAFAGLAATAARRLGSRARDRRDAATLLRAMDAEGGYTTRWFDGNAAEWLRIFRSERLLDRPLRVLEIGCWEGRSTEFLLRCLPRAQVTAVDTWAGSVEHVGDPRLARVEALFDAHVARFGARVTKAKLPSAEFFRQHAPAPSFDVVVVDGSHEYADVLADVTNSFARLVRGGIMICDDYFWEHGRAAEATPAAAINRFLREIRGRYRLLSVTTQVVLRKNA